MLIYFLQGFAALLLVVGAYTISKEIYLYLTKDYFNHCILVFCEEDSPEHIIRTAINRFPNTEIFVSVPDTIPPEYHDIVKKLADDYEYIHVLTKNNRTES